MRVIEAPNTLDMKLREISIFLAGSIEMGTAEDWQTNVINELAECQNLVVLNPRRKDWDNSWKQTTEDENFVEQVNWELDGIERSSVVIFYFDPKTYSPISLLELGYVLGRDLNVLVCCPEGFYRKGNVDIICRRNGVKVYENLYEITDYIKGLVNGQR